MAWDHCRKREEDVLPPYCLTWRTETRRHSELRIRRGKRPVSVNRTCALRFPSLAVYDLVYNAKAKAWETNQRERQVAHRS